jgi:hypothetical protein
MLTTTLDDATRAIADLDAMLRHESTRLRHAKDPVQHETLMCRADTLLDARLKAMLERDVFERDGE